jgi:colicin import membrane protein
LTYVETSADKVRSFIYAVGVHVLCIALMVLGLGWTHAVRPVNAAGPVIEATLVNYTAQPLPRPKTAPPAPPKKEEPKPKPDELSKLPPIPPKAEDRTNQERIDRLALEKARAEREQEEKHKREQQVLEQEERLTKMERERREQLEDVRKKLDAAARQRKIEAEKLAQLEDLAHQTKEVKAPPQPPRADTRQPGNEGTDESLLGRYQIALQSVVLSNWLRPDSAQPGLQCTLNITQIPGGEVIEVHVVAPCNADDITRRSIEAAVLRAQPLPYQGYEKVFQRNINFNFHFDG